MPVSEFSAAERIARVLAGRQWSSNAEGVEPHASPKVDLRWYDYLDDAIAILRTLREPDIVMADAGDVGIWRAMVEAAIQDYAGDGEVLAAGQGAASLAVVVRESPLRPPKLGNVSD